MTKYVRVPQPMRAEDTFWGGAPGKYLANLQQTQQILPYASGDGLGQGLYNAAAFIPNTILGQGLMAPTSDVVNQARDVAGGRTTPYNELVSPQAKLARNVLGLDNQDTQENVLKTLLPFFVAAGVLGKASGFKGLPEGTLPQIGSKASAKYDVRNPLGQYAKTKTKNFPTKWVRGSDR